MPRWLRHIFVWTAMLAFAVGAKLHLPLVQTAGWVGMAASYAKMVSLPDAVRLAVAGPELCGVCEYVRDAQHAKQTADAVIGESLAAPDTPALAPDLVGEIFIQTPEDSGARRIPQNCFAEARFGRPETPPPKTA